MSDNEDNYDGDDFDDVEEDEGLDDLENPEEEGQENVEILPSGERQQANQKRITTPYMTKYERARVLGTRALQIALRDAKTSVLHVSVSCQVSSSGPSAEGAFTGEIDKFLATVEQAHLKRTLTLESE
ncbi:DNA-directed RNA polymerases I, II, and III subunit RPABC2 isoform X3 [Phascolarctos cinereus]|uniref:DNA-directed RNA polymerases I, II, and III subunit RPABC2 isoform X4 n=1 Tax=Phascolarctos cinereus TaxID=38626 RepID=A0A6P5JZS1_PHACI|nr:DNA-directed RNA polymerases I, II, and III subunit RPABC2 isoform X4 [Phascolarctos cinereus]